jgi:hypothetical protein
MLFVYGDSAQDEIIINNLKLKNTPTFDETINVHNIDASAMQLYNILSEYKKNNIDKILVDDNDKKYIPNPIYSTKSKWIEKTIDNEQRYFLSEYIGNHRLQNEVKNHDDLDQKILSNDIIICDVYDSKYQFYNKLLDTDNWIIVRTLPTDVKKISPLLKILMKRKNPEKTIIILNSNDLKIAGFNISRGVSWEQLIIETYIELTESELFEFFKYLIVCFEHEGIMTFDNIKKNYSLLYYPKEIEGDYLRKYHSKVFGIVNTFHAVMSIKFYEKDDRSDMSSLLGDISRFGLLSMRWLIKHGYTDQCDYPYAKLIEYIMSNKIEADNKEIKIINLLRKDITTLTSILERKLKNEKSPDELYKNIINNGIEKTLIDIPLLKYENFISIDRNEIESYRKIHNHFEEYLLDQNVKKPLSVCVFGPPGAGKSFGINEMVRHFQKIRDIKTHMCNFNLSQFNLDDLPYAFDEIRDISLKGEVPIVFWDEFDSEVDGQELGWLKRFLAPIQDGIYYEKANRHFIGKTIFIFAGSVYHNLKQIENVKEKYKAYKLPDFLDRAAENLDIPGLSPLRQDRLYKIKCVIIIRKVIEKYLSINESDKITLPSIDKFLNLLDRSDYEHGIRTLESEVKQLFTIR